MNQAGEGVEGGGREVGWRGRGRRAAGCAGRAEGDGQEPGVGVTHRHLAGRYRLLHRGATHKHTPARTAPSFNPPSKPHPVSRQPRCHSRPSAPSSLAPPFLPPFLPAAAAAGAAAPPALANTPLCSGRGARSSAARAELTPGSTGPMARAKQPSACAAHMDGERRATRPTSTRAHNCLESTDPAAHS